MSCENRRPADLPPLSQRLAAFPAAPADDAACMQLALREAEAAREEDEVPVGAILVCGGHIIAASHNRREGRRCATCHAELTAIEESCRALGGWRLPDSTLYVTLEPCPMCAGAALNARVGRVVYGAADPRGGALGSLCDLAALPFNHRMLVTRGVEEEACRQLLTDYFRAKRRAQQG